jgi:REP element-mobilizing transposase RayT
LKLSVLILRREQFTFFDLEVSGGCYHVVMHGNYREALFSTPRDRHILNNIVAEALMVIEHDRVHFVE